MVLFRPQPPAVAGNVPVWQGGLEDNQSVFNLAVQRAVMESQEADRIRRQEAPQATEQKRVEDMLTQQNQELKKHNERWINQMTESHNKMQDTVLSAASRAMGGGASTGHGITGKQKRQDLAADADAVPSKRIKTAAGLDSLLRNAEGLLSESEPNVIYARKKVGRILTCDEARGLFDCLMDAVSASNVFTVEMIREELTEMYDIQRENQTGE